MDKPTRVDQLLTFAACPNGKEVAALSAMMRESAVVIPSVANGRRDDDSLTVERRRMPQCRCSVHRAIR
jgi:hypothetical protein